MSEAAALVVAAGRGHRFGAEMPKQFLSLAGKPVLRHSLEAFATHPAVAAVQTVIHPDDRDLYDTAAAGLDLRPPADGGATRQDSVRLGLAALADLAPKRVLIHDGARPFVSGEIIDRVLAGLESHPGVIPAVPVADTLKRVEDGSVSGTVDRSGLWRAQTPQGFRYADILAAHADFAGREMTDDAALLEAAGLTVGIVEGAERNFKITSKDDMERAEGLLAGGRRETRCGTGFDVHRFGPPVPGGLTIQLCGLAVPHDRALLGHSDADVGLHAITDAILGALGQGDIGSHFPPSDPQWKGADSAVFLCAAGELAAARDGRIVHLDVTLICEAPKIGPLREAMVARIAEILELDPGRISVKATTTESLGFTGRREGIAAQAIASLELPGG
ncbi:MAG: bifunctional 2-C-methyl-D-erythritol 4-phosphate cytidylyltransferase/2-C-methyl-D-erythritol 2,4-cyclodiphosphate synthase [Kiloniellales bacterium]|nr:bifunctional 2-C-methyl-D-erythritol 4-phosphate cytidylyltransferase/2-C-methyl-D-erythritol 2,4-cyclodiphosphate synthase [Kiloniellales bacterium]MDJ0980580.1 bifunctional 2-C-methyl-D-erythritol 4-phosphate cytidylyltransferase/2-C-methyl-D-erythritol 2,4-cyclodiphosphate synthase [Kiloniellales bacterium]